MKKVLFIACCSVFLSFSAQAQSTNDSGASDKVSGGVLSIVASPATSAEGMSKGQPEMGSVLAITGSAYVVTGIAEGSGDVIKLTVESVKGGAKFLVEMSKSAFKASGTAVGAALEVSATASGTLLVASGKVLAFIPNQVGKALLEHRRVEP